MNDMQNRSARAALAAVLALGLTACGEAAGSFLGEAPGITVALVDASASVAPEDREIHVESLQAIAAGLEGGDRLLVGPVSARAGWRPGLDVSVEQSNIRLVQEEAVSKVRSEVEDILPALVPGKASAGSASETRLLEAIAAASQAYGSPPFSNAELVLLSDGVEDSPVGNLSGNRVTADDITKALDKAEQAGLLPNMAGLRLTVAGAGGRDYASVKAFWQAWCERTGATLVSYGRLPYRDRIGG